MTRFIHAAMRHSAFFHDTMPHFPELILQDRTPLGVDRKMTGIVNGQRLKTYKNLGCIIKWREGLTAFGPYVLLRHMSISTSMSNSVAIAFNVSTVGFRLPFSI